VVKVSILDHHVILLMEVLHYDVPAAQISRRRSDVSQEPRSDGPSPCEVFSTTPGSIGQLTVP